MSSKRWESFCRFQALPLGSVCVSHAVADVSSATIVFRETRNTARETRALPKTNFTHAA